MHSRVCFGFEGSLPKEKVVPEGATFSSQILGVPTPPRRQLSPFPHVRGGP